MSARNYISPRDRNNIKLIDSLPNINFQKFGYRGKELPVLSANNSNSINRNLSYSPFAGSFGDRAGTPFSDFFSDSETGTPDFRSEESDSSSGSALQRSTAEATKILAEEWERIERTLYNEDGEKCTRPQMLEECKQWRELHPQFRIIGKALRIPEKKWCYRQIEHDEIIAMAYSDYEEFSESGERLSESSTDVTPQNSPRTSITEFHEPKLSREKVSFVKSYKEQPELPDSFLSLLQITPIHIHSPLLKRRSNPSILRSEIASSKWMKSRPDSSIHNDRNSAKSFVSLDTRNYSTALSASERKKVLNYRVVTAKHRDFSLQPLHSTDYMQRPAMNQRNVRKVSLPPLLLEEEKRKVVSNSAKKQKNRKNIPKSVYTSHKV